MKRTAHAFFALVLTGATFPAAQAAEPVLTIDCSHPHLLRMTDVSAVTGIDNFSAAYAEREMLQHQATRLCKNPAIAVVHFVPDSTVTVLPLDSVAAR